MKTLVPTAAHSARSAHLPANAVGSAGKTVALCALLLLTAWLTVPMWGMVHVEGFSASIESLALHLSQGSLRPYDTLFPFNLEFFATSRAGAVLALAGVYSVFPGSGDTAFTATMLFGAALLGTSSAVLLRRWTGLSWPWALLALLLLPGITESTFFYNDNVLSSGLATAGLAALWWYAPHKLSGWQPWLGGLLLGAAAVVRADAIVLLPAAMLSVALQRRTIGAMLAPQLCLCVAAAAVPVLTLPALGFHFLDTLQTAQRAVALWDRETWHLGHLKTLMLFFGLPGLAASALGAALLVRRRQWELLLLLAGMPLLFNIVYFGKLWEVRALIPTTAFCVTLAAIGAQWLWQSAPRWMLGAAVAVVVGLALAPPRGVWLLDGPRSLTGRLWAPLMWQGWQDEARAGYRTIDAAVARAGGSGTAGAATARGAGLPNDTPSAAATVLATPTWNADRYLHLALQQQGWSVAQTPGTDCGGTVETFVKGDARVLHLRLHRPFVGGWQRVIPDRWSRFVQTCGLPADGTPVRMILPSSLLPRLGSIDNAQAQAPTWLPAVVSEQFPTWPRAPLRLVEIGAEQRPKLAAALKADVDGSAPADRQQAAPDAAPLLQQRLQLR